MTEPDRQQQARELSMLAEDVPPKRDLWPAIADAIRDGTREQTPGKTQTRQLRRGWYAPVAVAAAVAFMAVGFWLGRVPTDEGVLLADRGIPADAGAVTVAMGPEYAVLREQLATRAMATLEQLTPEDRQKVEQSLMDIRSSVIELETALGADPTNALLQSFLVQMYDEEMRVLATMDNLSQAGEEVTL